MQFTLFVVLNKSSLWNLKLQAPFGGEQFTLPQQEKSLQKFFSVFFFAVTIGNMISTGMKIKIN